MPVIATRDGIGYPFLGDKQKPISTNMDAGESLRRMARNRT